MKKLSLKVGEIITPEEKIKNCSILLKNGRIRRITPQKDTKASDELDFSNYIAVPGYIDIHVHGYKGHKFTSSKEEDFLKISKSIKSHGVTTLLPTTYSETFDKLLKVCRTYRKIRKETSDGAEMPGIHLEGPHFGSGDEKGTQNPEKLRPPDINELERLYEASGENIARVTLAPELSGAIEYIERAKESGIAVSAGHTAANYQEGLESFNAGVNICNHIYNGMVEFHHRSPGIVGACLNRRDVYAEMIADLIHLHPATIAITARAKGVDRSILITDSISATGLPNGEYELSGQKTVVKDGVSRVKETDRLAGSTLTLDKAVKNVVKEVGFDLEDAIKMVTSNPARAIGLEDRGKILPGYRADITILNSSLEVVGTIKDGKPIYRKNGK